MDSWEVYCRGEPAKNQPEKWLCSLYTESKAIDVAKEYLKKNPTATLLIHKSLGRMWVDKDNKLCADGSVPTLWIST